MQIVSGARLTHYSWDHKDLATLDTAAISKEMTDLETAFTNIIGKFPQYMRPPYLSINGNVLSTLGGLGYHVIQTSIDTKDYENATPATIGNAVTKFIAGVDAGGSITLSHDVHETTVDTLVPEMIRILKERGLTCMSHH